jgi:hypothetical protein
MHTISPHIESTPVELFQAADLVLFPMGDNLVLVYSKQSQAARLLRTEVADLLMHCREFKTLDDHIQAYCRARQVSPAAMRSIRRELQHLMQTGYLVSRSSMQIALQRSSEQALSTSIASVGIPTCDRLETLRQNVAGCIEHCKHYGRTNDFVIVDDSTTTETRDACRGMLRALKSRYGVDIAYGGLEEKSVFARKLAEAGDIPLEIICFACIGDKQPGLTTVGANRNALLLHTVGDLIFSSDDDISYQLAASPGMTEGLTLHAMGNPLDVWFFPNRGSALESVQFVEQDLLALHEQWLGRDPGYCSAQYAQDGRLSLEHADARLLRQLAAHPAKIALTLNGTIGDCSWDNPNYHLFLQGETFKRLISSEQAYQSAHVSREMAQAVNQVTITPKADPLFAMCMGLDNRELLPPFTPLGRAEDVAFGTMLSKCFNAAYTAHLPWMLLHAPPETRSFTAQRLFGVGFSSWIPSCVGRFDPGFARTPAERLRKLGLYVQEIGHLPGPAFEDFVRQHMWQSMSVLIAGLEARLQQLAEPSPFWLQDVRAYIAQARQSALLPADQLYTIAGGRGTLQRLLVRYGQAIEWWPAMVETAKYLREQGYRLAQPI